ncbi:MAG: UTP--glucose-1-phosphate uridylyltransferase [Verrucomicrobiota bacterium]|jgi:UTP--glucose-1-phosphate uridylyltransferase
MRVPAVRTAVIPAAGFGTRLMPASKAVPKEMFPVLDKPVLQYVVEEALACGMDRLVLVISEGKEAIRRHLENDARLEAFLAARGKSDILQKVRDIAGAAEVEYVIQPEQNGLADALLCAREAVGGEPFGVLLGDAIIVSPPGEPSGLGQLKAVYERTGQAVVALREVALEQVSRYGIVDGEAMDPADPALIQVRDLIEKPSPDAAPSRLAINARYIFPASIFTYLDALPKSAGVEAYLTDAMVQLAHREGLWGYLWNARRYDIGNIPDYISCLLDLALADPKLGPIVRERLAHSSGLGPGE